MLNKTLERESFFPLFLQSRLHEVYSEAVRFYNRTKQNKQQQQQMRFYALVGRPDVQILVYTCGFLGSPSNTVRRSGYCYCLGDETGSEKLGHLSKVTQL